MFFGQGPPCGCYWYDAAAVQEPQPYWARQQQHQPFPLVAIDSKTTILSSMSSTTLTQTYKNPLSKSIDQIQYVFPLYDGVTVVDFTCRVGERFIQGRVQERDQAKATFKAAAERGEAAGLLEMSLSASDTFSTTIANVPADAKVVVTIKYIGELKHDAQVDGLRFTIPTALAPRYGELGYNTSGISPSESNMSITVDVSLPTGQSIKKIQSPSHPISISMGSLSTDNDEEPVLSKASATLTRGSTELDKDFVLQILSKDLDNPNAVLEVYEDDHKQRALMLTLVPRFALKPIRPEIIFVADRSGSMGGCIDTLKTALTTFLKSLPVGIHFNICSFGSHYSLLWPKSKLYSQASLDEALRHVSTFRADYGGTETFKAIQASLKSQIGTFPTEILLLTDGLIDQQDELVKYISKASRDDKSPARLFTIGIGDGVSHSLLEGVSRAGMGFAQTVMVDERMDIKLVRMLKGALTPHILDYSLEINYEKAEKNDPEKMDEDFEMIEKLDAASIVSVSEGEVTSIADPSTLTKKAISLFSSRQKVQQKEEEHDKEQTKKYASLPTISAPRLLQAPDKIPPLYPYSRSNVYILMSPETANLIPTSVVLRGTCDEGPLELEIPVTNLPQPGKTIHQLAARKAIQDLEEGRGWVYSAKDVKTQKPLQKMYAKVMDEIAEREAVNLGVEYQVGGKWCSFVAVEEHADGKKEVMNAKQNVLQDTMPDAQTRFGMPRMPTAAPRKRAAVAPPVLGVTAFGLAAKSQQSFGGGMDRRMAPAGPLFGSSSVASPPPPAAPASFASMQACKKVSLGRAESKDGGIYADEDMEEVEVDFDEGGGGTSASPNTLQALITTQGFDGRWTATSIPWSNMPTTREEALKVLGRSTSLPNGVSQDDILATVLAVLIFERTLQSEQGAWELVVDKARGWLDSLGIDREIEEAFKAMANLVPQA